MSSELPPLFEFTEFTGESHDYEEEVLSFEEVVMNYSLPPQQPAIIQKAPSNDLKFPGKTMTETNNNRIQSFDRAMSRSGEDFYPKPTYNKIDTKTNQWKSSPNPSWNTKSQSTNNRNLTMTPNAALQLLNSKDVASKVTGKRPSSFLNDSDFPPISLSHSTPSSNKKHQSNNNTMSQNYSMPAAPATTPTNASISLTSSFYNYSPSKVDDCQNVIFAPQQITKQAFEDRKSHMHYFRCDLQLDEIIQQLDHELQEIAETRDDYQHNYQHSLYQQLYMYYQPFQYSWMLYYCQSIEQCELKIKIYRVLDTENDLEFMDSDESSVQYFLPQHYIITFEQINGSSLLFKQLFERVKLALGTYDDCWTKDLTVSVQSKCVLMSPTDYYYYQHAKADATSLNGSSYTTPTTSEKCREVLNCPPQPMTSSSDLMAMLTHAEFYADPTNIARLDQWISQIVQYETKLEQFEAIQNLCQLCHAAHDEKKFLTLLEQLRLIEILMTVFVPSASRTPFPPSTPTAAAVADSVKAAIPVDNDDELTNDLYSIKPYVIQMLLYFTQREQSVRTMLKDQHFKGFITSVASTSSPHFDSFDAGSATIQLKWMKLSRDCQRLTEELCKMIQTEEEVGEYDDGMIFSPKNNHHHHHHHHHSGGGHQLKSIC
eukprot:gene9577-10397_t